LVFHGSSPVNKKPIATFYANGKTKGQRANAMRISDRMRDLLTVLQQLAAEFFLKRRWLQIPPQTQATFNL
jgi:hypothetical protein